MKLTIRKVLSLLTALAVLWSALPAAAQEASPVTVTLSVPKSVIAVGETITLTASVSGAAAVEDAVLWYYEETPSPVCRASEDGSAFTLTGLAEGTVTVVATYRDDISVFDEAVIRVEPAPVIPVTGLVLTPSAVTLAAGAEMSLTAVLTPENATDREIRWSTSDAGVAAVDQTGRVRATGAGRAVITAAAGGFSGVCGVTVTAGAVRSLTLSHASLTLTQGSGRRLTAVTDPEGAPVSWQSSDPGVAAVSADGYVTAREAGSAVITASAGGREAVCPVTVTGGGVTIRPGSVSLALGGSAMLEADVDLEGVSGSSVIWSTSDPSVAYIYRRDNTGSATTVYASGKGTAVITAAVEYGGRVYADTCLVEAGGGIGAEATVYRSGSGVALGDGDDAGGVSVAEQIANEIGSLTGWSQELDYVVFQPPLSVSGKGSLSARPSRSYSYRSDASGYSLRDVVFTPDGDFTGDVSFPFTAADTGQNSYSGAVTFHVEEGVQEAGILYAARTGESVTLDADDLTAFWDGQYPGGKLAYIVFTSVSRGGLYGVSAGGQKLTDVEAGGVRCCPSPGSREMGLDDLTYVPTPDTSSAVIRFTAYGAPRGGGSQTARSGSITIVYTDEDVPPITCRASAADAAVGLRSADFLGAYQSAVDAAGSADLTIRFLSVPQSGDLYWDWSLDQNGRVSGVRLTEANLDSFLFTAGGSAGKRIDEVAYVPDRPGGKDTVSYVCYEDGAPRFTGVIDFDGTSAGGLTVNYISRGGPVSFAPGDFFTGEARYASYITFSAPASGRLTCGGADAASGRFSLSGGSGCQSFSGLTYAPADGYTGSVQIPFRACDALDRSLAYGTVNIFITAPAAVFTDVKADAWYYAYVSSLAGMGILSGYGDNTFRPEGELTWAEALKLIMMAVGYSDLSIANGGGAWAEGFLLRAQADGLVSGSVDLNGVITREDFAAVAARALNLPPAAYSPFTDTASGYAAALYGAFVNGQRIISGDGDGRFRPNDAIRRSEVCKIICLMRDYQL